MSIKAHLLKTITLQQLYNPYLTSKKHPNECKRLPVNLNVLTDFCIIQWSIAQLQRQKTLQNNWKLKIPSFFSQSTRHPPIFHPKLKTNSIWCMKYYGFYIKASCEITIFEDNLKMEALCFIGYVFVETEYIVFHKWYWNCARCMRGDNGWVSGWF